MRAFIVGVTLLVCTAANAADTPVQTSARVQGARWKFWCRLPARVSLDGIESVQDGHWPP